MTGSITQWLPPPDANGPISCETCGCRLVASELETWHHFPSLHVGQDARGCRPACVDAEHDRHGRAISEDIVAAA